jgi:hypothetical protein
MNQADQTQPAQSKPEKNGAKKTEKAETQPSTSAPDPSKPIELALLRAAKLMLNQQDGSNAIAVGKYMANGGNVDGVVKRMVRYPDGSVVVTVAAPVRLGTPAVAEDKHILVQGDFEGEVMTDAVRDALRRQGLLL